MNPAFHTRLVALLLFVMATGCTPDSGTQSLPNTDADREAILEQSRRLSAAYMAGDIQTLVSLYTEDGVAVPGNRDFVRGHEALSRLWTLPEGRTILRHEATPTTLEVDGNHAYDWGYFEGQAAQNGEPMAPFRGAYVIVWERSADGQWRIAADMWNSLPD